MATAALREPQGGDPNGFALVREAVIPPDDTGDRASERPERRRARSRRSGRATYTVKTGDTRGSISRKKDTSTEAPVVPSTS